MYKRLHFSNIFRYPFDLRCLATISNRPIWTGTRAIIQIDNTHLIRCRTLRTCTSCMNLEEESGKDGRPAQSSSTVDREEVGRFSQIASSWWNKAHDDALHNLNALRVPLIRDTLVRQRTDRKDSPNLAKSNKPLEGLKILDVGCGVGFLAEPLARLGANVTGLDASAENIIEAISHSKLDPEVTGRVKYVSSEIETIADSAYQTYDAVVASEVLEHVTDHALFIRACSKIMKPGGSLFITSINKTTLSYALAIVAAEKIFRIVESGLHDWNKFIALNDLRLLLSQNGLQTHLIHGMTLNPLTKKWSWIRDTSVNYALHAVKTEHPTSDSDSSSSSDSE